MAKITGFKELSKQLSRMGKAAGGKALRSAVMTASLPALRAAQSAAPVGAPPYESGDPYPTKTYKGRFKTPGFLRRNIARKSFLSRDRRFVRVSIGPKKEAFYGTQFIELGTSSIPKRPWLEPSFRASQGAMLARLGEQLKGIIAKAAR